MISTMDGIRSLCYSKSALNFETKQNLAIASYGKFAWNYAAYYNIIDNFIFGLVGSFSSKRVICKNLQAIKGNYGWDNSKRDKKVNYHVRSPCSESIMHFFASGYSCWWAQSSGTIVSEGTWCTGNCLQSFNVHSRTSWQGSSEQFTSPYIW